jgi:hypothetical protein
MHALLRTHTFWLHDNCWTSNSDVHALNFHQVEDGSKHYLRVNSFETNCDPSLELVGQSFIDNVSAADKFNNTFKHWTPVDHGFILHMQNKESGDQFLLDELKFDLVGVPSAELH